MAKTAELSRPNSCTLTPWPKQLVRQFLSSFWLCAVSYSQQDQILHPLGNNHSLLTKLFDQKVANSMRISASQCHVAKRINTIVCGGAKGIQTEGTVYLALT